MYCHSSGLTKNEKHEKSVYLKKMVILFVAGNSSQKIVRREGRQFFFGLD